MINNQISLTLKIFIYFISFAFLIVMIFWILEVAVLDQFYAETKKQNCYDLSKLIEETFKIYDIDIIEDNLGEIRDQFREFELNNEVNIWLVNKNDQQLVSYIYGPRDAGSSVLKPSEIDNIWSKIKRSNLTEYFYERESDFIFSKTITLRDNEEVLLVLVSRIVPIDLIGKVWRRQFYVISLVIIVVTAFFATIVSQLVSRPIASLNKAAQSLAKGKYDVKFEAHDYAEIKELADTLNYASTELGKLDQYQKDLIANVSHDLRTPLTLIAGYSEMMQDYPSEISKENLQIISDEAKRLTSLVNDILNLTNIQNNNTSYQKEDYNITENIENIIRRNSKLLAQVDCEVVFEKDIDIIVNADQQKIEIAIYNFLNNAVNYCGDDKLVLVKQQVEEDYVKISFIDHGIGIEEEHIKDIWNRYYKGNKNHKRGIGGSGLGLSIVKAVLDGHDLEYGVNSKVGVGSEFWFKMPIVDRVMESEKNEE